MGVCRGPEGIAGKVSTGLDAQLSGLPPFAHRLCHDLRTELLFATAVASAGESNVEAPRRILVAVHGS